MALRYDEIADIIKIIDASACDELILETGELKLVVRRRGGNGTEVLPRPAGTAPATSATEAHPSAVPAAAPAAPQPAADAGEIEVRAPMVGTFYRAPSPDAPVFVEIGSEVREGQPLCIIEVMKLFTTIYAETDGQVVRIEAENGELVEYGRVLFVIRKSADAPG